MLAKEIRDAWWKFTLGPLLFLGFALNGLPPYEEIQEDHATETPRIGPDGTPLPIPEPPDPLELMFMSHVMNSEFIVALLAAAFGAAVISGETSRGTIFLLLSKPIGRTRLLLSKYAVGALALFVAISLGSLGLLALQSIYEYPTGSLDVLGVSLSVVLMWLGSLFVFGVALLASVVFKDTIRSFLVTLLAGYLMFNMRVANGDDGINPLPQTLVLPDFWRYLNLYMGEELTLARFLVCLIAAVLPLLAALLLFQRRAY